VENRSFIILRIGSLQSRHLLFKGLAMLVCVFSVLAVNLSQRVNVGSLASHHPGIASSNLLGLVEGRKSCGWVSVLP